MAIDEAIGTGIQESRSPPTIRFYKWKPGAVSIGYFQAIADEVSIESCRSMNIDFVRRKTGGGAVYHDPEGEIAYSLLAPETMFPKDIRRSYRDICSFIVSGLAKLGIGAEFRPINDVVVNGRKISGSAQTRRHGVLTQHGTVLYRLDRSTMFSVLKPSASKLSDKQAKSFETYVTCASELGCTCEDELYRALLQGFTDGRDWYYGELTDLEMTGAAELEKKYASHEWNFMR